jgi:predicted GNAT family N-acyltransferase
VIQVREIFNEKDMEKAFDIRRIVFVLEQKVDPAEEYDEFEHQCVHFLALYEGIPCGTCRIRMTENGYKLERFAVLNQFRGKGVGAALVRACMDHPILYKPGTYIYMHAQEHAIEFYKKFGFVAKGERFWECDIPHFTMYFRKN